MPSKSHQPAAKKINVTLTQVAKAVNVSVSTASYALRGSPLVSAETAAKVRKAAEKLGYRPNPNISALMTHIRTAHAVPKGERLAFVWVVTPQPGDDHTMMDLMVSTARERAGQIGYEVEEFHLDEPGMTAKRLQGILVSRGIRGVILCPMHTSENFTLDWDWSHFASVILGGRSCIPELHHAGVHHYLIVRLAMLKLREVGCQKIAGLLEQGITAVCKMANTAAFAEHHPDPHNARQALRVCDCVTPDIVDWLEKLRPEALITTFARVEMLKAAGYRPPPSLRIVVLDWRPNPMGFGGVSIGEEEIASNVVDLVVTQLHRNELGPPTRVKMLLATGHWHDSGRG